MLTPAELEDITGYLRPSGQIRWLKKHGWKFEESRHGPKVLRAYRDRRMGLNVEQEIRGWKPDFSRIG